MSQPVKRWGVRYTRNPGDSYVRWIECPEDGEDPETRARELSSSRAGSLYLSRELVSQTIIYGPVVDES